MVKEKLVEETAKGNYEQAAGLGILGALLSLGIAPVLAIILGLLAVGIVLTAYFLPIILAGVIGGVVFYIAREAELRGINLVLAPVIAALGSLALFSFTDLTLWSMSLVGQTMGAEAQWSIFPNIARILQLILGIIVTGFVLLSLLVIRAVGESGIADAVVGFGAAVFTGVVLSSVFDLRVPGLSEEAILGSSWVLSMIFGFLAGIVVLYASWKWD